MVCKACHLELNSDNADLSVYFSSDSESIHVEVSCNSCSAEHWAMLDSDELHTEHEEEE